ncbi:hypothetical protein TKK_0016684 [Trichogramma kaykai]
MANDSAVELMRVLNGVRNLLQALKALGSPVQHWDHFTVFLTRSKITQQCRVKWEDSVNQLRDPTVPDTFEDLCKFLEAERNALSLLESTQNFAKRTLHAASDSKASTSKNRKSSNFVQASSSQSPCPVCSEDHALELCATFRKQSVSERKRTLGQKRLCYRCLEAHMAKNCKSSLTCFNCNGKHHTLIHAPLKKAGNKSGTAKQAQRILRLPDGRYQVRLPLRADAPTDWLNSRQIARSCLLSLERKLGKNPLLYAEYKASIEQMIKADQMRKIEIQPQNYRKHYFLPHHAVVKDSRTTTRVRPVFNASARNSAGHSLNEHLMTGPNLLPQIVLTLAHWRNYPIAFVADVSKMYLQVRLHPEDWRPQTLLWRDDPLKEMENYVLTTVTFGSGPSAFLANRTLRQLAEDEGEKYPLATPIVRQEMYMDDVLSGAFDIKVAMQKRDQLNALFSARGFTLAKWMTNDDQMLHSFGPDSLAKESTLKVGLGFSVLGLVWEPRTDVFRFNVSIEPLTNPITKRKVLSCIAGMFDPSGWIAPVLISMKIFMQSLWLLTEEWDTPLPASEVKRWRAFERDWQVLATIVIPRWTGILSGAYLELHGFADASKFAYAAVLYVRVLYHGQARVTLLASKTKVAPLKTLSIPRLELCAAAALRSSSAHLLAKLASSFIATEDFVTVSLYLWSDSKTTLHWLHGIPARWPIFVANRCADVAHLTPRATWQYINTKQNPADLASRGSTAGALLDKKLWWHGPEALVATSQPWTTTNFDNSHEATAEIETPERIALLQEVTPPPECEIIARFSSYSRMRRVLVSRTSTF